MTTCRELITEAAEVFEALAPGDSLTVDEIASGMKAVQWLMLRLDEARGPKTDVDVTSDYTAGENERVRVQAGYTVNVTLPNTISTFRAQENDYGFRSTTPPVGSSAVGDGASLRAPRDGSRIEITYLSSDTAPVLYFYRADINAWVNVAALTIDAVMPLNAVYLQDAAALLAVRLCGRWPSHASNIPTAQMKRDEAEARSRLFVRPGVTRSTVRMEAF